MILFPLQASGKTNLHDAVTLDLNCELAFAGYTFYRFGYMNLGTLKYIGNFIKKLFCSFHQKTCSSLHQFGYFYLHISKFFLKFFQN